jgi:glycosyltransferase involved in cell wall biosynthesis
VTSPLFSIVTPVYNTPVDVLDETIRSVTGQDFADWQLILVDDVSPNAEVRDFLAAAAADDDRITVILRAENGNISAASNDALDVAAGEYIVLLDHDDLLADGALASVAAVLAADPLVDYLYSDEDKVDDAGVFYDAFRKPGWSPERLRGQMYCGHLSVLRTALVRAVGGFRSEYDGSQDHDLVLRVTEKARRVHHLPEVLYHWRALAESTASSGEAKPYAWHAGLRAVQSHVERIGLDGEACLGEWFGTYTIRRRLPASTSVSVVLVMTAPAPDQHADDAAAPPPVARTLRSLVHSTSHRLVDYVVVTPAGTPDAVLEELAALSSGALVHVGLTPDEDALSLVARRNRGFLASHGDVVLFVDENLDVAAGDVITDLAAGLADDGVGLTGPLVTEPDGGVRSAGHDHTNRQYGRALTGLALGDPGPFCALVIDREVSGLDAECVAVRREVFAEVGGFSEQLPRGLGDVDLSFKVRATGRRLVWQHRTRLAAREPGIPFSHATGDDLALVRARWGAPVAEEYLRH